MAFLFTPVVDSVAERSTVVLELPWLRLGLTLGENACAVAARRIVAAAKSFI